MSAPTIDPAVLTDTVAARRMAALEAITTAALQWHRGRLSGLDLQATIAAHARALDTDPGLHLAWPEQDQEPVADVDYLPAADVEDFDRNDAGDRCLRAFGLEFDPDNSFDPCEVTA